MKDRWLRFQTSHSPAIINTKIGNTGDSDVVGDWQRINWSITYIDGRSLADILAPLEIEQSTLDQEQLKKIFSDEILKKYLGNKNEAIDSLLESFHQGALLHPVSAAMSHVFTNEDFGPSSGAKHSTKQIHIKTCDQGFTLQEVYTVNRCVLKPDASNALEKMFSESVILPDPKEQFVIQAQATILVSFDNKSDPVSVLSNNISYGSKYVKNIADKRNLFDKFVDFLRNIISKINFINNKCHPNSVKNLSFEEKNERGEEQEQRTGCGFC